MNDSGQLAGYGIRTTGETQGFVLTPVPEPAMTLLAATASLGLLIRRRRNAA